MVGILIFCGFIFVPGRQDFPSDTRAFSVTSLKRKPLY